MCQVNIVCKQKWYQKVTSSADCQIKDVYNSKAWWTSMIYSKGDGVKLATYMEVLKQNTGPMLNGILVTC